MTSDPHQQPAPISRDQLALTRTRLANERTMLAYTRTAIMFGVSGATALKLYGDTAWTVVLGWTLLTAAIGVAMLGVRRFVQLDRTL